MAPFPGDRPRENLPNASLIYGIAAAALLVFSLFFFFTGSWVTGGLLLFLAGCFLGYALFFLRYLG